MIWNKARLTIFLKGLWNLTEKMVAPSIVIAGIGQAAHLEGVHQLLFILSSVIVYWSFMDRLERRQNLNITAATTFVIPDGMDPDDIAGLIRVNRNNTLNIT